MESIELRGQSYQYAFLEEHNFNDLSHLFKQVYNTAVSVSYLKHKFGPFASELGYSWFSIARYTPDLSQTWGLYTSLELFSNFDKEGHVASVQRMRLGLQKQGYQFGLGLNLSGLGKTYAQTDANPGLFVRKQF